MKNQEVYQKAINRFGKDIQKTVAIEELSELTKEICKDFRGLADYEHIAEEMADVEIMLEELKIIYGNDNEVEQYKRKKIIRLAGRCGL